MKTQTRFQNMKAEQLRIEEAKAGLTKALVDYGKVTGHPRAFETALLLNVLDVGHPRIVNAFDSIPLITR